MKRMTIGLANQTKAIKADELQNVARALDKQVKRDVRPLWDVHADIIALENPRDIPAGVSPIIIVDETPNDFAGLHMITQGVPWAMILGHGKWTLAASHECIEMLIDPTGEATQNSIGLTLVNGQPQETGSRVDYLVEACDPIEDADHAYDINGVQVSDFYTPAFFDDKMRPGIAYSFNGALTKPRQIGRNGYLSWRDPLSGKLRQMRNFGSYSIVDLPERDATRETTRMFIDRHTHTPRTHPHLFYKKK